ncbi:MAG TPA: hypothetical protein VMB78_09040, partial [Dissulfurispiraceae bacterium]|nr:hypothetical protein [Dissulfurispiraceae bacterium]
MDKTREEVHMLLFAIEGDRMKLYMDYKPSIRRKITLGYYAGVAVILALFVFIFTELILVEKQLMFGDAINEFLDMTLEMRR